MVLRSSLLLLLALAAVSCGSATPVPVITSTPTALATPTHADGTELPLPLATPVNRPHASPIVLSYMAPDESFAARDARLPAFTTALEFSILDGSAHVQTFADGSYFVSMQARLTNASSSTLVLPSALSAGWTGFHIVSFEVLFHDSLLPTRIWCADAVRYTSLNDFVILRPREFEDYAIGFVLPPSGYSTQSGYVRLKSETIMVRVVYHNEQVGFFNEADDYQYSDINAWVGEVKSDAITIRLP